MQIQIISLWIDMMTSKLKEYEKFFRLQRRNQEKKFEQYAKTPIKDLFSEGKAYYGKIVGTTDFGQMVLRFDSIFTPRLKVPMEICIINSKAFLEYGHTIKSWNCTSLKFRENVGTHTSFSDALPIYFLSDRKTIGCGQIRLEMLDAVKPALNNHKELHFIMLEKLPPTELLKNLAEYISLHPDDKNLILQPKRTYDEWKPVELTSNDDVATQVLNALDDKGICVLQGPPGTGKSYTLGAIISKVTAVGKRVCVTTQSNASLISLISQETMQPLIDRGGIISKTVLSSEEKKKHPFLIPADKDLLISEGNLLCSTYYSLSRIINTVDSPIYDIIVIEEASQAFLTAIAAFIRLGKKCIIVGDPMQLPPVVEILNDADYSTIDIDTQANGMMTLVRSIDVPSFRITTSHRLTSVSANQSKVFYGGNLSSVQKKRILFQVPSEMVPFFPDEGGTILFNTDGDASANCSKAALDLIRKIVSVFAGYYPKRKLAILSPFVTTTKILQKEFCGDDQKLDILVETINRIQGETVDYTIFYIPTRNYRFAFSDNLFNVATSRSKSTTLLISDMPIDLIPISSNKVFNYLRHCKSVDLKLTDNINREEIKSLYPGLESIVDKLLDNDVRFSFDGDVDLLDPNGIVIATAGMLLENYKIAIDPVDDDSKIIFEHAGYRVISSSEFNVELLK